MRWEHYSSSINHSHFQLCTIVRCYSATVIGFQLECIFWRLTLRYDNKRILHPLCLYVSKMISLSALCIFWFSVMFCKWILDPVPTLNFESLVINTWWILSLWKNTPARFYHPSVKYGDEVSLGFPHLIPFEHGENECTTPLQLLLRILLRHKTWAQNSILPNVLLPQSHCFAFFVGFCCLYFISEVYAVSMLEFYTQLCPNMFVGFLLKWKLWSLPWRYENNLLSETHLVLILIVINL